ncbi:MAG: YybH family protein [Inhella sp.]|uniref:YybH family protein n=1 Tax=Inhella sp. TaxID=1921806 RepID=UPI0022BF0F6D|nr:nuclear transport factor 2 family protein [Inhella sp.]MCZ8234295.1 nuclear transport factor 2 family protein [Inhella sp.]
MNRSFRPETTSHPAPQAERRALVQAAAAVAAAALLPATALGAAGAASPSGPAAVAQAFARAFNARDLDALMVLYPAGSVFVPAPGQALVSPVAVRQALEGFLAIGLPIEMAVRHVYEAGDTALLVVDWAIRGVGADGRPVDMRGTATDVVARSPVGHWHYRIDNPFGGFQPTP